MKTLEIKEKLKNPIKEDEIVDWGNKYEYEEDEYEEEV